MPDRNAQYPPLLITFVLQEHCGRHSIRCCGCHPLQPPGTAGESPLRGLIELEGETVPVWNPPSVQPLTTTVSPEACILIHREANAEEHRRTGVLLRNIEEVMDTAAAVCKR